MITQIIKQTLNNEVVRIIIFNSDNDSIQTTFQFYTSENCENMKNQNMIELSCSLKTLKIKNRTYVRKFLLCQ